MTLVFNVITMIECVILQEIVLWFYKHNVFVNILFCILFVKLLFCKHSVFVNFSFVL